MDRTRYWVEIKDNKNVCDESLIETYFCGTFDEMTGNDYFEVIDKQLIGEQIGREIIDELGTGIIDFKNGYNTVEILERIRKYFLNALLIEIDTFVEEYLDNNLEYGDQWGHYEIPKPK